MSITQTIPTLPDAPQRSDPTNFSDDADTFLDALPDWGDDVNTWAGQANTLAAQISADAATSGTSFKGNWSDLTGAATVPSSVYHLSQYWNLTEDIADITAETPGTSTKWVRKFNTVVNALGDLGGGTDDIDYRLGDYVTATVSTGAQTFTFSNPPESGVNATFILFLTNGGSQTVTWPASVAWASATAPTLTAAGVDILIFTTNDGGTTWYGSVNSLDTK